MGVLDPQRSAYGVQIGGADVSRTTPLPTQKGGDASAPVRTQVRARPQWQELIIPASTRYIAVRNLSGANPARVQIRTAGGDYAALSVYPVQPGLSMAFDNVASIANLRYCSEVGHLQLEVITAADAVALPPAIAHANAATIERIERTTLAVSGRRILQFSSGAPRTTYYSVDGGVTFTAGYVWPAGTVGDIPQHGLITNTGALLVWTRINNDAAVVKLYRSTDNGVTFTEVTVYGPDGVTPVGSMRPPYGATGSLAALGKIGGVGSVWALYAAEYGETADTHKRITRSVDDGLTWRTMLDAADPAHLSPTVRHWHAVIYDFYRTRIVAFAGDSDAQQRCVYSDDDGTTWRVLGNFGGHQQFRVVGAAFDSAGALYWVSDGPRQGQGVWRAEILPGAAPGDPDQLGTPELLCNLNATGYGLLMLGDTIAVVTVLHPDNPLNDLGGIHVSRDRGRTWGRLPVVWEPTGADVVNTGYNRLWGPDSRGYFHVGMTGLDVVGTTVTGLKFRLPAAGL